MPARELLIDASRAGLPELAHGGYVAGVLAAALAADSARVRLRRPVPTGRPLRIERPAEDQAELHDDGGLLADAVAAEVLLHLPDPVGPAEAEAASRRFPGAVHHPFPDCLACGTRHPDGLRVLPGPVSGRAVVAAHWVPPAGLADRDGILPPELVCAALDCPALWALMVHAPPESPDRVVTSTLEIRLERPVLAGAPHVVMALADRPRGAAPDGRRRDPRARRRPVRGEPPDDGGGRRVGRAARARPLVLVAGCHRVARRLTLAAPWTGAPRPRSSSPRTNRSPSPASAPRSRTPARCSRAAASASPPARSPTPPAAAARLRAAAEPGQVLVTDAARWADLDGDAFRDAGPLPRGGGHAWELLWAEPVPRTRARLCGGPALEIDGQRIAAPGGQAGSLLAFLLASPERAAERGELIEILWPGRAPRDPQAALRPILSRLRRALGPAELEGRDRLRLLLPAPVWTDVGAATDALAAARSAARGEQWAPARAHADAALRLLRPGLLPGLADDWVTGPRLEAEELELEALEWIARASLALGGPELGAAERAGRELVTRSPFRETGHRFLMEALAGAGNVAEALRVYDDLRVLLRDELGTAPAGELQALHQRLLTGAGPERAIAAEPPPVALPSGLAPREGSEFVARDGELARLRAAWDAARGGRRGLVAVAGEPGIGKTRLVAEFAASARAEGTVLSAACQEEVLLPYQPFVEALRGAGLDWARVAAMPGAGELARVIPELPGEPGAPAGDAELQRYRLFEAIASLLDEIAARAPLALVLDDLHWADRGTLHLLRHVARAPREAPLLIVGTYRDAEVRPSHPLAELLADLRRDRLVERIALEGLGERDVGALIAAHAGHVAPPSLVGTVHEHTDGNPFFVEEVLRHLIESGIVFERGGRWTSALTPDEIGVPEGVQEVLARRLARLSDPCRSALAAAAVLGRECAFDVLLPTAAIEEDELIAALEEARDAQLVVESEEADGPAYAFTHALVRHALYTGLSAPRRRRLHARAAAAIAEVQGEGEPAALALHHRLAGSAGDPAQAVEWSMRAAAQAASRFAWEETATHWEGALAVMARAGGRERERADLLVALGDLMVVIGDLQRQIACLEEALALYDGLEDVERSARVHSRLGMARSLMDSVAAAHLDIGAAFRHFDAARAVLGKGPPRLAAGHLEVGVATALTYALQDRARAGGGAARHGDRRGRGRRAAVGGRGRGLRVARAGRGAAARGVRRAGARVRRRRPPPAAVPRLHGHEHPRPVHLGHRRARRRAGALRAAAAAAVRRRRRQPPPVARRARALPRLARRAGGGPPAAARGDRELDHAFARADHGPLGRQPRRGRAAGGGDARHQPPDREPLGRLGLAPARRARARAARRARRRRGAARGGRGDRGRRGRGVLRAVGAAGPRPGARRAGPGRGGA